MSYGNETETDVGADNRSPEAISGPDRAEHASASAFRREYGPVRGTVKYHNSWFAGLDRSLRKARITETYDDYLMRALGRSVVASFVALVLGVLVGIVAITLPIEVLPDILGSTPATAGTLVFLAVAIFAVSLVLQYFYPRVRADLRRRRINSTLPHAVIFMYALSEGDVNLGTIMRKLADAEGSYGEVSGEFGAVVNDIDRFNIDTLSALEAAKQRSPSEEFQEFLDDLMSVFGSGGNLNVFLRDRSEDQLQTAREQQENFFESLAAIVEGYITLVFAGPIFLIVLLIIMSFTGPDTLVFVNIVTYGFIPLGIVSFLAFVHVLNTQYNPGVTVDLEDRTELSELDEFETDEAEEYRSSKRWQEVKEFAGRPARALRDQPILSLWLTLPLGWVLWSALIVTGVASPTLEAYQNNSFRVTTMLVVVPLLVPSFGLMLAHEVERRRIEDVKRRFPEILSGLASANRNGIRFVECIPLVARNSEGVLARHMRRLNSDIRATRDVYSSLRRFAAEVSVPRVSRVTSIIIEGHKSSGSLYRVLEIAAQDAKERARLDTSRKQTMYPYLIFFVIGVLVYLFVALLLTEIFFETIGELTEQQEGREFLQSALSGGGSDVPITAFETAIYHSLVIQAFGNGLVIGKLSDNKLLTGLKYANVMTVFVVVVFGVIAA